MSVMQIFGKNPNDPTIVDTPAGTIPVSQAMGAIPMQPQDPNIVVPQSPKQQQQQYLIDLIANPPKKEKSKAADIKTGYRTKDAIAGGLGLILSGIFGGKSGMSSFAQGYVGKKEQITGEKRQAQADSENEEWASKVQAYNSQVNSAKTVLDFMDQEEKAIEAGKTQDQKTADALRDDFRMMYQNLNTAFSQAKSKPDLQRIATHMRYIEGQLGLPQATPDDAGLDMIWRQKSSQARNMIVDNWRQTEGQYLQRYGYVPDDAVAGLEKFRQQSIQELQDYGVEEATLPPISSEKGLMFKAAEEKKREFDARLKQQKTIHTDKIAESKANRELRKQFLDVASRNSDTSRMNYLLRAIDDDTKKINDGISKQIMAYDKDIAALRGKQRATDSYEARAKIEADIKGKLAGKAFLESQREAPEKNAPSNDTRSVRRKIADYPDKHRANQALRAIEAGADPNAVFQKLTGG